MQARLAKTAMVASLAAFALLVAYGNVADYGSNFEFVRHVLSMDTSFPDSALKYRAITTPALWRLAYWIIIAGEGLTGLAFAAAAVEMARSSVAMQAAFSGASASSISAARSVSWSGFSASWLSGESGLRCGTRKNGTASKRRFGST